jgi:WD40 repeat protein
VHSVSLTSDTSRVVSTGEDGRILEWDLNAPLSPYREHLLAEPAGQVIFSADSRFFYTTDKNGSVSVWDANTYTKKCSSSVELGYSSSLILSPDGGQLIVGTESGDLWVLDAGDLQVVARRKAISGQILPVGFSVDGTSLVAVEFGNKISQWNTDTWQLISRAESGLDFRYFKKARYAIPQRSDVLLCVSEDSDLVWWDLVHSKELARVDVKSRGIKNEFAVSPTEPLLASIAEGDFISLWDWKTRQPAGKVRGPRDFHSVAFSPDGRRLVSGSSDKGALRLWDVSTRQEIARLDADVTRTLISVQFSPDGNIICAVDKAGVYYFWRAPSFEEIKTIEAKQRSKERR